MIYSFSGDIGSGKDTSAKILAILWDNRQLNNQGVKDFLRKDVKTSFQNKKWADKLKDFVCSLIGYTRIQLEDRELKEKILPEAWWYYKIPNGKGKFTLVDYLNNDKDEKWLKMANPRYLVKTTPRLLLQLVGTECGRNILHPNIWVNSLISEYREPDIAAIKRRRKGFNAIYGYYLPKWVITDTRFPNEIKAVQDRQGICIKVIRDVEYGQYLETPGKDYEDLDSNQNLLTKEHFRRDNMNQEFKTKWNIKSDEKVRHESDTALDAFKDWDYVLENHGDIDSLINNIRRILQAEMPYAHFNNK